MYIDYYKSAFLSYVATNKGGERVFLSILSMGFYVMVIGFLIGGLSITNRQFPERNHLFLITTFFVISCCIGIFVGGLIAIWLSVRLLEIVIAIIAIILLVVLFIKYHPVRGYFQAHHRLIWPLFMVMFLLIGIEWVKVQLTGWFVVLFSCFFLFSLIGGAIFQLFIVQKAWRMQSVHYLPLVWLLFIAMLKLL